MTSVIVIGFLGIIFIILSKNQLIRIFGNNHIFIEKLKNVAWFQNHWLAGLSLFGINASLFFLTGVILYLLMYLLIPFIHLIVMVLAVIVSIYIWIVLNKAWSGSPINRFKMGAVGSSFYLLLTLIFLYMLVTIEPIYPGEDTFMRFIGLLMATFVTAVAFLTCFIMTSFSKSH